MRSSWGSLAVALLVLAGLLGAGALLVRGGPGATPSPLPAVAGAPAMPAAPALPVRYATGPAPVRITVAFKRAPRAGLLFDLRTGRVLWSRNPHRRHAVASLAKMMTALVVVDRSRPDEGVLITREALATDGSKVGLLAPGRRVRLETLLWGLLLPSGNDAAVALAQHVSGSVPAFVSEMTAQGRRLGLTCTTFSSPDGLMDQGNRACARDLAVVAREVLARPRLARIVARDQVALPALIPRQVRRGKRKRTVWRPGRLYLNNHNPLLRAGYPGTTGIKTGYTDAAGRCLVATVRRGRTTLGLVLLGSPDPGGQAARILDRGWTALRRARRISPGRVRPGVQ